MIILDVVTLIMNFGLNCQKGKNYAYLLNVFLMLWTLLGSRGDSKHEYYHQKLQSIRTSHDTKLECWLHCGVVDILVECKAET